MSTREDHATHVNVPGWERAASAAAGTALAYAGLRKGGLAAAAGAAVGAALVTRGVTGHCMVYDRLGIDGTGEPPMVHLKVAITIGRTAEEIYRFWRRLENLPLFMQHIESVTSVSDTTSEWVAEEGPKRLRWKAEIVADEPGKRIAWRSLPDAALKNEGEVRFKAAPGDRGTEVHVDMKYAPPLGRLGALASSFLRRMTGAQVHMELRRLKQILETGELATGAMFPEGGDSATYGLRQAVRPTLEAAAVSEVES